MSGYFSGVIRFAWCISFAIAIPIKRIVLKTNNKQHVRPMVQMLVILPVLSQSFLSGPEDRVNRELGILA